MTRLFPPERWISWVTRMTFCPPLPTIVRPETIWLKVCVGVSDAAAFDSANAAFWIAAMDIRTMPPAMVVPPPLMLICAVLSASSTPLTFPPPVAEYREIEIYRAADLAAMFRVAEEFYPDLVPFLSLMAFGFLRTEELIPRFVGDPVLEWSALDWSDGQIFVPHAVAKKARASQAMNAQSRSTRP
jgi:hypothetical protein